MPQLGPGTLSITVPAGGTAAAFECEVSGGSITHSYEEVDSPTRLCDTAKRKPNKVRGPDGVRMAVANDLSAAGLYALCQANDLAVADLEYIPNTDDGASWAGEIELSLPAEIGADEWGADIESEFEWSSIGPLTFTASTATP